jgi:hypothetical protein
MGSFQGIYHGNRGDTTTNNYEIGERVRPEPAVGPGRIWLVECDPAGLSPVHAGLLRRANVVLYERTLGRVLAESLPTGVYAEPLPATAAAEPTVALRARHFAADGWRVVQLVERRDGRDRLLQFAATDLDQPGGAASSGPRATAQGQIFTANGLAG